MVLLGSTLHALPAAADGHTKLSIYESIGSPVQDLRFGDTVAWHGDDLIVGSPGSAKVVVMGIRDGLWKVLQTLEGPKNSQFGAGIAVDGDVLVIGAPNQHKSGGGYGAAYVYKHGGASWRLADRMDSAPDDVDYGEEVAISGSWIAVAAPDLYISDEALRQTSRVHMYKLQGDDAVFKQTLSDPGLLSRTMFGYDLDLQGSRLIVGAPGWYYQDTVEPGSAFIYGLSGSQWTQEAELGPSALNDGSGFGIAIAQTKNEVLVCDDASIFIADNDRSLHVYRKSGSTWTVSQSFEDVRCNQIEASESRMITRGTFSPYLRVYGREGSSWGPDSFTSRSQPSDISLHRGIAALGFSHSRGGTVQLLGNNDGPEARITLPEEPADLDGNGHEPVTFLASKSNGTDLAYHWYVDGALVGTGKELSQSLSVGPHEIMLAVSDPMLGTDQAKRVFTVHGPPTPEPDFSWLPGTILGNQEVRFVDESTSSYGHIIAWSWDMDADGSPDATGPTPTWSFETSGTKQVTLTVHTDIDTKASLTKKITVRNVAPVADAGMDQIIRDHPAGTTIEVSLDGTRSHDPDGEVESYSWARNGKRFSTSSQPTLRLGAGVHDIDLTVKDDKGVRDTDRVTILILEKDGQAGGGGENGTGSPTSPANRRPPNAAFDWQRADGPPERAIAFTDKSTDADNRIVMWWYDVDADGSIDASEPNPVLGLAKFGAHDVQLTVTDETGLQTTVTRNVFIKNGAPTAIIEARTTDAYVGQKVLLVDNSTDPEGSNLSRTWDFGDGETGTQQAPAHTYDKAGSYTVTLTVQDPEGASSKATVTIKVQAVPPGTTVPPVAGGPMAEQAPESPFAEENNPDKVDSGSGTNADGDSTKDQADNADAGPYGLASQEPRPNAAAVVLDPREPWLWIGVAFATLVLVTIVLSARRR